MGMRKIALLFAALAVASQAQTSTDNLSLSAQGKRSGIAFNRPIEAPLYEAYPVIEDYRLNQSIQGAIRWSTFSILGGAALGALVLGVHEDLDGPFLGAAAGLAVGLPLGAVLGYHKGKGWEQRQAGPGGFQARRLRIGYELEAGAGLGSGLDAGEKGLALNYRLPIAPPWSPDEFQLAFQDRTWYDNSETAPVVEGNDSRYSIRLLKNFRDQVVNPYAGIALGLADGYIYRAGPGQPAEQPSYRSAFVDVLAGVMVNVFDLVHARAQLSYEPYGPYYSIRPHGDFSYASNFGFQLSLGTYIF